MKLAHAAGLAGAFVLGAGAMAMAEGAARAATPPQTDTYRALGLFGDVLDVTMRQSLKPVDPLKAIHGALNGMLKALDAHGGYLTPEAFELMKTATTQKVAGVGLTLAEDELGTVVLAAGGPAAEAGVRPGDYVAAVAGISVRDEEGAALGIQGPPGTPVDVVFIRDGRQIRLTLTRRAVFEPAVTSRMEGDVGYVALKSLPEGAGAQVRQAIQGLKAANPRLKGLVLDLRDCPGGLVVEVVAVLEDFLASGEAFTEFGRDPRDVDKYNLRGHDELAGQPLIVLTDTATAAGAEIIAGVLQARGRAKVVGETTFGSGTIQTVIPLRGGASGALKITTASFTLVGGRSLQKLGVTPDVAVARDAADAGRFRRREANLPNALDPPPGSPVPAPARLALPPAGFSGDFQLARALATLDAPAKR